MKQIDIKKPKYIIPILILPFILGIGWLVKDMINSAPAEETTLVETEELNRGTCKNLCLAKYL